VYNIVKEVIEWNYINVLADVTAKPRALAIVHRIVHADVIDD
jgi:hypothetical protein